MKTCSKMVPHTFDNEGMESETVDLPCGKQVNAVGIHKGACAASDETITKALGAYMVRHKLDGLPPELPPDEKQAEGDGVAPVIDRKPDEKKPDEKPDEKKRKPRGCPVEGCTGATKGPKYGWRCAEHAPAWQAEYTRKKAPQGEKPKGQQEASQEAEGAAPHIKRDAAGKPQSKPSEWELSEAEIEDFAKIGTVAGPILVTGAHKLRMWAGNSVLHADVKPLLEAHLDTMGGVAGDACARILRRRLPQLAKACGPELYLLLILGGVVFGRAPKVYTEEEIQAMESMARAQARMQRAAMEVMNQKQAA